MLGAKRKHLFLPIELIQRMKDLAAKKHEHEAVLYREAVRQYLKKES